MVKKKNQSDVYILGIETSCDETSVAIVKNGREVLSCVIASSIELHQITNGVVPEVAARAQIEYIIPVLDQALLDSNIKLSQISKIAVTKAPGLLGSLLVGITTANTLAAFTKIPIVGVPHIWGHIYANLLDNIEDPQFPALVLTVSGGHNDIYLWEGHGKFQLLGSSIDDSGGECFDKCGRMIGLPYPAGPDVSKHASSGNRNAFQLPRPNSHSKDLNFSFSGLKTAFLYLLESIIQNTTGKMHSSEITKIASTFSEKQKNDLCASLETAIVDTLWIKMKKALKTHNCQEVHLSGGVSANTFLRTYFEENIKKYYPDIILRYPKNTIYCTDNAAMIAGCAYFCDFDEGYVDVDM